MEKREFNEIYKLKEMLETAGILYEFMDKEKTIDGGKWHHLQIMCPSFNIKSSYISVVQCYGSCGDEDDLLEIMKFGEDDIRGYLSADEVYGIISRIAFRKPSEYLAYKEPKGVIKRPFYNWYDFYDGEGKAK